MARLTKGMRENTVRRVLDFKFKERVKALKNKEHALFDKVVDALQGEYKTAIEAIPVEYFHTSIRFNVRSTKRAFHAGRERESISVSVEGSHPRPDRNVLGVWHNLTDKTVPKPVYEQAVAYANEWAEYLNERTELERKLSALVHSVATTNKLYEVWPELHEIVPMPDEPLKQDPSTALTVSVAELNKLIPLPVRKEDAGDSGQKQERRARKRNA